MVGARSKYQATGYEEGRQAALGASHSNIQTWYKVPLLEQELGTEPSLQTRQAFKVQG